MLEWICPKCGRAVEPQFQSCPFCSREAASEAAPAQPLETLGGAPARVVRRVRVVRKSPFQWQDVERGFRFGLGFVAALACAYFVLFLIAYYANQHAWVETLARWLYR